MHYQKRHYEIVQYLERLAPGEWARFADIATTPTDWLSRNRVNELVREGIVQRRRTPGGGGAAAYQYRLMKHQNVEDGQS